MDNVEPPLHPTPMVFPMMKGKMTVDASKKPTFQGIWGMTHADVTKGGYVNDFKVVRMASVRPDEEMPQFAGEYQGYFRLATKGNSIETVPETFTLRFVPHTNHGFNVYGSGSNKYGANKIVGTVTPSGKMEIFKIPPGVSAGEPAGQSAVTAVAATPRAKAGGGPKKKSGGSAKKVAATPDNKFGMPGMHVKTLKDALLLLKKSDKGLIFQAPVPANFRGQKGLYSDIIENPMDLGTVLINVDEKYRTAAECIADIRLVFSNARLFNLDTDPVNALATSLSGKFEAFLANHHAALSSNKNVNNSSVRVATQRAADVPDAPPAAAAQSSAVPSTPIGAGGIGKRLSAPPISATSAAPPAPAPAPSAGSGSDVKPAGGAAKSKGFGSGKGSKGPTALSWEEQDRLAKDVNKIFRLGNEQPDNERAQARVYALWSFAKAYVSEKDRVMVDGGKGAEIRMDTLNVKRQRQLRDVVMFFLEDGKNDPPPQPKLKQHPAQRDSTNSEKDEKPSDKESVEGTDPSATTAVGIRKRSRSDLSDSEDEDEEERRDSVSPGKISRGGSGASNGDEDEPQNDGGDRSADSDDGENDEDDQMPTRSGQAERMDSTRLILEARPGQETDINLDLDDEEEEEEEEESSGGSDKKGGSNAGDNGSRDGGDSGDMDTQWSQAQAEKKEREDRERARAATEKALEEQRLKDQERRQKARVEEGLKLSRKRAAEKARLEKLALEKKNREKAELEEKKEAERVAREEAQPSVDLDQCRADATLMSAMDESVYDD